MSNIKERVSAFIKYKKLNNKQFEDICGLGNGFVSKIGYSIREPKIELISKSFPELNRDWLVRGVGEMLANENPTPKYNEAVPIQQDVVYIPLVNQFAYAGYLDGYSDCTYLEQLPKIPFIVDHEGAWKLYSF